MARKSFNMKLICSLIGVLVIIVFLSLGMKFLSWKTVTVGDVYTISYPYTWNSTGSAQDFVISNYSGGLSFQDRSSPKEYAKVNIVQVKKTDKINMKSTTNSILALFPKAKVTKESNYGNLQAVRISVTGEENEFILVENGDYIYKIQLIVFSDAPTYKTKSYSNTLNKSLPVYIFEIKKPLFGSF